MNEVGTPFFDAKIFDNLYIRSYSSHDVEIFYTQIILLNRGLRIFEDFCFNARLSRVESECVMSNIDGIKI
jgi:hypothetical protein